MSRSVSAAMRAALNAQETGEVVLVLATIEHAALAQPIRVVNNTEDIVAQGETFVAFPFEIVLPDDADRSPRARIAIDNTSREIVATLRALPDAPSVTFQVIRASDPSQIEAEFPGFRLSDVHYDVATVEGELTLEDFSQSRWPAGRFGPAGFPGLF